MPDLPPESPPKAPVIPIGLATKLGLLFAVLAAVGAAIAPLFEGDQTPEMIALIVAALGAVYKVLDGRYNQATAAIAGKPELATNSGASDVEDPEVDEEFIPPPEEDELRGDFPEDPPVDAEPEGGLGGKPGLTMEHDHPHGGHH